MSTAPGTSTTLARAAIPEPSKADLGSGHMKPRGALAFGAGTVSALRLRRIVPAVLTVAFVTLAAGCSLIQPSNQVLADQGVSTAPSGRISPPAPTSAASTQPSWAGALGAGVALTAPAVAAPGNDSPGAVVQGFVNAVNAGPLLLVCPYFPPSAQASCRVGAASAPNSGDTIRDFALGYVAVDGNEALVGSTGTFCVPNDTPVCMSNADPASIFSSAEPFSELWAQSVVANGSSAGNIYALIPCVKVGAGWYLYLEPGDNGSAPKSSVDM
jgi:hypothetical protein